jgi:hypothetical protein
VLGWCSSVSFGRYRRARAVALHAGESRRRMARVPITRPALQLESTATTGSPPQSEFAWGAPTSSIEPREYLAFTDFSVEENDRAPVTCLGDVQL